MLKQSQIASSVVPPDSRGHSREFVQGRDIGVPSRRIPCVSKAVAPVTFQPATAEEADSRLHCFGLKRSSMYAFFGCLLGTCSTVVLKGLLDMSEFREVD